MLAEEVVLELPEFSLMLAEEVVLELLEFSLMLAEEVVLELPEFSSFPRKGKLKVTFLLFILVFNFGDFCLILIIGFNLADMGSV